MTELSRYRVQVFGASIDSPAANKEFAARENLNFPLLSDPEKRYARALGVLGPGGMFAQRWTFVVDEQGIIREIDRQVKPGSHGKDLAAKLDALGIPKK